jgi:hypothetical protein
MGARAKMRQDGAKAAQLAVQAPWSAKMTTWRESGKKRTGDDARLSLAPLTVEEALREAMATGKPPEQPKRKRPAAKRRIKANPPEQVKRGRPKNATEMDSES